MGRLKEQLKHRGYNAKERVYIYSGAIMGAIAPILGARYLLFNGIETHNWAQEALVWGGVLLTNMSTMIVSPHIPIPLYTTIAGIAFGSLVASNSKRKRFDKKRTLENITKEASKN